MGGYAHSSTSSAPEQSVRMRMRIINCSCREKCDEAMAGGGATWKIALREGFFFPRDGTMFGRVADVQRLKQGGFV